MENNTILEALPHVLIPTGKIKKWNMEMTMNYH